MNIAIFTPNKNPYSATFIQAHKNYLKGNVFFYYGMSTIRLENHPPLASSKRKIYLKAIEHLMHKPENYARDAVILSSLKKNKIDVILVEYGTHAYRLLSVLEKSNIPFVTHFPGFDASSHKVIEECEEYKTMFKAASGIVAVSTVMYNRLHSLGCPKEKLHYNVYGANPIFASRAPQFSKKQAVAVGRFVDKKAPYYTILAFKEVVKKHPDAQLFMAGSGFLFPTCKNLIQLYKLEKNIHLLGVVTPEEIATLMQESRCFVQHSITATNGDQEGTPLSILEASLSGLPVVSTYHAGIKDVIAHEKTGLLCEEHDVQAMTENLNKIFDDIDFARMLGANARATHLEKFTLERHIHALDLLLENIIKQRK